VRVAVPFGQYDRRRHRRANVTWPVTVTWLDGDRPDAATGLTVDVSCGGLLARLGRSPGGGGRCAVALQTPTGIFSVAGEILRTGDATAIAFDDVEEGATDALAAALDAADPPPPAPEPDVGPGPWQAWVVVDGVTQGPLPVSCTGSRLFVFDPALGGLDRGDLLVAFIDDASGRRHVCSLRVVSLAGGRVRATWT
jgi:hypothetical protein